tara:strand:+ start:133 stop:297 length:165 start_codon:yes stop_codon:yes gene_type:complete
MGQLQLDQEMTLLLLLLKEGMGGILKQHLATVEVEAAVLVVLVLLVDLLKEQLA